MIIGAGSVVTKDIPSNSLAVGNPAKVIKDFDEYVEKQHKLLSISQRFNYGPDEKEQEIIRTYLEDNRIGYIK